jgi:hypothetical protein
MCQSHALGVANRLRRSHSEAQLAYYLFPNKVLLHLQAYFLYWASEDRLAQIETKKRLQT